MGLGSVALLFLESIRPLSNVLLNLVVFSKPFMEIFLTEENYNEFLELIQDRKNLEYMINRLEELEDGLAHSTD